MSLERTIEESTLGVLRAAAPEDFDLPLWEAALFAANVVARSIRGDISDADIRAPLESLIQALALAHARLAVLDDDGAASEVQPFVIVARRRVLRLLGELHEASRKLWDGAEVVA